MLSAQFVALYELFKPVNLYLGHIISMPQCKTAETPVR